VDYCGVHPAGLQSRHRRCTRPGRGNGTHATLAQQTFENLETRFAAGDDQARCVATERVQHAGGDGTVGDVPPLRTDPRRSRDQPLPDPADPDRRSVGDNHAADHVYGNGIRTEEVVDPDLERRRKSKGGIDPWQVAAGFDRPDRLSAHPSSGGQLGLGQPGFLTM
jgi:hypothetical protein